MEKERSAYHFDQDKIQMAKGNILRVVLKWKKNKKKKDRAYSPEPLLGIFYN